MRETDAPAKKTALLPKLKLTSKCQIDIVVVTASVQLKRTLIFVWLKHWIPACCRKPPKSPEGSTAMNRSRGFTLIELLIVVAIIAILAAIAVPNFLEAQVRSKVARVKADMRTLATAAEAYAVDHNKSPIGEMQIPAYWGTANPSWLTGYDTSEWIWSFWTTPVAYMTSIPHDPFASKGKIDQVSKTGPVKLISSTRYNYRAGYDHCVDRTKPNGLSNLNFGIASYFNKAGVTWMMFSWGPSKRRLSGDGKGGDAGKIVCHIPSDASQWNYPDGIYDPSNGTVSYGKILRSNKESLP